MAGNKCFQNERNRRDDKRGTRWSQRKSWRYQGI